MSNAKYEPTKYAGVFTRTDNKNKKKFYVRYVIGGRGGDHKFECVGSPDEGWTAAKASLERADRIRGKSKSNRAKRKLSENAPVNIRWTLDRLWETYREANPKKNSNRNIEISVYNLHLKQPFGEKTVSELSTLEIDRFRNELSEKGLKPATIRNTLELMRRLFNFGEKHGYYEIPRTLHFNFPKVDNQKTEYLNDEELQRYEKALETYVSTANSDERQYFVAYAHLVMHTGIRRSAAIALHWDDCDFERGFIALRGVDAKNDKTQFIPMSQKVRELLAGLPHDNGEYIFPQLDNDTYTNHMRRIRELAGLPKDFRPIHGLRHNFGSRVASSGKVDLYTLKNLMTHASYAMTQRYAHLADETMHRAAGVVDDVMTVKKKTEEAAPEAVASE